MPCNWTIITLHNLIKRNIDSKNEIDYQMTFKVEMLFCLLNLNTKRKNVQIKLDHRRCMSVERWYQIQNRWFKYSLNLKSLNYVNLFNKNLIWLQNAVWVIDGAHLTLNFGIFSKLRF